MRRAWPAAVWLLTRAGVVALYYGPHDWVAGDVSYFDASITGAGAAGLAHTMVEYPLPAVGVVALPWWVAHLLGQPELYRHLVTALVLLTDAAFTMLLARSGGRQGRPGLLAWLAAVPLLGATVLARFDVLPGVLAGTALLLLVARPRLAGLAAALATGLKLWPVLLLPGLTARRQERGPLVTVFAATGVVLAGGSLLLAGWGRLVSPLTWQADRGLQIESVLGTPAMVGWAADPTAFTVAYSPFNAYEVTGPGVSALLTVAGPLLAAALVAVALLGARAWRVGATLGDEGVAWVLLASVTAFIAASSVFSPQYLLWLLPLGAAALSLHGRSRGLRWWVALLLVDAGLTQLLFPVGYRHLIDATATSPWLVVLLAARNLLLVWLLVQAFSEAWRWTASRPALRGTTDAPSGGAPTTPDGASAAA